jgi:hypothetical protein
MAQATRLRLRRVSLIAMACACLVAPVPAQAIDDGRSGAERAFAIGLDVLIVRPLGAIAVVVGAAFFLPVALVTSPNGKDAIGHAWETFVVVPSDSTFNRPLGEF